VKFTGFLLLVAGWVIVLTAVAVLENPRTRAGFVCAGLGVEGLGLGLVFRAHLVIRGERR
jgi:hypothetical protein